MATSKADEMLDEPVWALHAIAVFAAYRKLGFPYETIHLRIASAPPPQNDCVVVTLGRTPHEVLFTSFVITCAALEEGGFDREGALGTLERVARLWMDAHPDDRERVLAEVDRYVDHEGLRTKLKHLGLLDGKVIPLDVVTITGRERVWSC